MTETLGASLPLILLLAAIVCAPFAVRWYTQRRAMGPLGRNGARELREMQIVSATMLGPQQRVITLEAGPAEDRVWLVLGVTSAGITALHCAPAPMADSPPWPQSPGAAHAPHPATASVARTAPAVPAAPAAPAVGAQDSAW